jgi:hypothetical protein
VAVNRDVVAAVALALVGVVAVSFAAGTLTSAVAPGDGGVGPGSGDDRDGGASGLVGGPGDAPREDVTLPIPPVVLTLLTALAAAAAVWVLLTSHRDAVKVVAAVAVAVVVAVAVGELLPDTLAAGVPMAGGPVPAPDGGGGLSPGDDAAPPSPLLVVVVGLLALGAVGVLVGVSRRGTERESVVDDEEDDAAAAVGRAAGRAADRIERNAAGDNEVYRAWREMTGHLDVDDPETSTPGEFAAAAVEVGMDREDVAELTRLFERVRYGGEVATEETERRAVGTLRRIESTYTEEGDA